MNKCTFPFKGPLGAALFLTRQNIFSFRNDLSVSMPSGWLSSNTVLYILGIIAQAVSSRLSTAAARVRARVRSCGICGQIGIDTDFSRGICGQIGIDTGFSPSTSVSPANSHSPNCSTIIIIYHLGLVQQAK
jgi:hypothetical protein